MLWIHQGKGEAKARSMKWGGMAGQLEQKWEREKECVGRWEEPWYCWKEVWLSGEARKVGHKGAQSQWREPGLCQVGKGSRLLKALIRGKQGPISLLEKSRRCILRPLSNRRNTFSLSLLSSNSNSLNLQNLNQPKGLFLAFGTLQNVNNRDSLWWEQQTSWPGDRF